MATVFAKAGCWMLRFTMVVYAGGIFGDAEVAVCAKQ
jgi:hypothetical protein